MYSLGLLIVDLETARRRLLYIFEEQDKGSGHTVAESSPRSPHHQAKHVNGDPQTFTGGPIVLLARRARGR